MNKIAFVAFLALFSFSLTNAQTICIDPGHGYGENGENKDGRSETEILTNVAVGKYLSDSLEALDYTVIMTRENSDTGSWMSLAQRAELADYYESDRLLSIHCNACSSCGATGTETFWGSRNTTDVNIDRTFSDLVQKHMSVIGEWKDRRSAEDIEYLKINLGVLQGFTPGCLNEIGFVDTPSDAEKLLDEEWRQKFAHAYVLAINESLINYPPQSTSIKDNELIFNVYPSPFTDHINIEPKLSNFNVSLFNIEGKLILKKHHCNGELSDLEYLKPGVYLLQIETQTDCRMLKVLKK